MVPRFPFSLLILSLFCVKAAFAQDLGGAEQTPESHPCPVETMHYDISWSGGIKIGEMTLATGPGSDGSRCEIRARVRDVGLFHFFYPVDDTFVTQVGAHDWLPLRYEVEQREGAGYEAFRLTLYNQENGEIRYRKNQEQERNFQVDGPVHNEFSSFFATRFLPWTAEQTRCVVPTWAERTRHAVEVELRGAKSLASSLLGEVDCLEVLPRMTFKAELRAVTCSQPARETQRVSSRALRAKARNVT